MDSQLLQNEIDVLSSRLLSLLKLVPGKRLALKADRESDLWKVFCVGEGPPREVLAAPCELHAVPLPRVYIKSTLYEADQVAAEIVWLASVWADRLLNNVVGAGAMFWLEHGDSLMSTDVTYYTTRVHAANASASITPIDQ